ncbi:uncharacterized protein LOC126369700 [Pectinophora gossypiella]|uniref:uncharacterized protein LOC126369700 n=1 Tax=Pectinophora gossypiella TaxID=13191 RepID=UPI00214E66C4|nr:uncharacterized protein LOC126369700 [Pectinophora gossypiella]
MWKKLRDGYVFLYEFKREMVYITNHINIWTKKMSDQVFLSILKNSNSGLTIDESELLRKGKLMFKNPEELKSIKFEEDSAEKILNVTMIMSFGYPLKLKLKLKEGSPQLLYLKVTMPLLRVILDLRASEHELRQLLLKKDKEIEEYKCEGGEIALRSLKTVPFNDEAHMSKHTTFSDNYCIAHNEEISVTETYEKEEQEVNDSNGPANEVKREPLVSIKNEIKCEPSSAESESDRVKNEPHSTSETVIIKSEMSTESQTRVALSPNKKRKKLNL